jgi:hypothetical protein
MTTLSLLETLPSEMVYNILLYLPGYSMGNFCKSSQTCRGLASRRMHQMMLIHKVRGRLMSYIIKLMDRHFHYTKWDGGKYFTMMYRSPVINITSIVKFRAEQNRLLDLWNDKIDDPDRVCESCGIKLGWSYYVFDGEDRLPSVTLIIRIYCHACYHRGVLGFYNNHGRLPSKAGDHIEVQFIAMQTILEPVPPVPTILTKFFDRMEGGVYNFNRK